CADRGARVTHAEGVVFALGAAWEGRESAVLLDGVQPIPTPGEYLVGVGLMADVPDEPVARGVEDVVQSDRQLHGAEAGGEMPAAGADALDEKLAQLGGERGQFANAQAAQIRRAADRSEQRVLVQRYGHRHVSLHKRRGGTERQRPRRVSWHG